MFSESADLYDIVYSEFKDYPAEAGQIATIIRRENPAAQRILDVACGSGEHARLLTAEHGFAVDGLDLDQAFVRIAAAKLPNARVYDADMTTFSIEERYDVISCLFSSIGYVRTLENVTATLERFRAHLAPGGVILVEPWFPPGVLQAGRITLQTTEGPAISVARMSQVTVDGRMSRIRFEYLIGRNGKIEHLVELHELGLFEAEELLACFAAAGLTATHDPIGLSGRGLYVARAAA
jgi:SAM-dependent methyltransferase